MDLDVAEAQASFPADKELVLSKILGGTRSHSSVILL